MLFKGSVFVVIDRDTKEQRGEREKKKREEMWRRVKIGLKRMEKKEKKKKMKEEGKKIRGLAGVREEDQEARVRVMICRVVGEPATTTPTLHRPEKEETKRG
ncbi:hypothetical protein ANTQUA_LOCUS6180 [Anthophora quadrimaculata]